MDAGGDPLFADRRAAGRVLGRVLAGWLAERADRSAGAPVDDLLVLGLPRGGVPVAAEVARELHAALDVFVVRKLGVPGHEELAMGAIGPGGVRYVDEALVIRLGVDPTEVAAVSRREQVELARRERVYRRGRPPPHLAGRTVVIVDDGVATGSSVRAAALATRAAGAARVVAAAPVGPPDARVALATTCDDVILVAEPTGFGAVGSYYRDFAPTTDAEVRAALDAVVDPPPRRGDGPTDRSPLSP